MAKVNTSSGGAAEVGDYTIITSAKTIDGSSGTIVVPIFRVVGSIRGRDLQGFVTTALGNHTAANFRMNDQTATIQISAAAGVTLTNYPANSVVYKRGDSSAAAVAADATTNPPLTGPPFAASFCHMASWVMSSKTGANTDIEYVYTTTDAPTTGAILFSFRYKIFDNTTTVTAI